MSHRMSMSHRTFDTEDINKRSESSSNEEVRLPLEAGLQEKGVANPTLRDHPMSAFLTSSSTQLETELLKMEPCRTASLDKKQELWLAKKYKFLLTYKKNDAWRTKELSSETMLGALSLFIHTTAEGVDGVVHSINRLQGC